MGWWVYMVECADGTLYTGVTTDVARRVEEHNQGKAGARYTRARRPVSLVYTEPVPDRSQAQRREAELKALSRDEKEALRVGKDEAAAGVAATGAPGTLYLVGTPIGNLEDISARALRTLREVALIAAEDTRHTRELLTHFDIHTSLVSYHEHNLRTAGPQLLQRLLQGDSVALVSDAGMPGISDPGEDLVRLAAEAGVQVVAVPGPVAGIAALVTSGLAAGSFVFIGFLPRSGKARRQALAELAGERRTMVLYEAPHRLLETVEDLSAVLGATRQAAVARELTKRFEEVKRGTLAELLAHFEISRPRGEFTVVVSGAVAAAPAAALSREPADLAAATAALEAGGLDRKAAMKQVARERGISKEDVYKAVLAQREGH